jgi:hypothetical protein
MPTCSQCDVSHDHQDCPYAFLSPTPPSYEED